MGLFKFLLLLSISSCLCQKDCTGVDCPDLKNCIDEVLENGACCATCMQTGCMCEGYQYYDCVNAGFRKGKVPEGESYFVDFGSTECSCPKGGGRISCHFIPCPELPANCIDFSEPADGCSQCERIGCVYEEQKYEAGHSFHMDPCQVCHCPNDGGNLMCYPIPDCDRRKVHKPMLATTTEENLPRRRHNEPIRNIFNAHGSRASFSKPFPVSHRDNLPPFKLNPRPSQIERVEEEAKAEKVAEVEDVEEVEEAEEVEDIEEEDYDYPTTTSSDSLEPSLEPDLASSTTDPTIISGSYPENVTPHQTIHRGAKQELKERLGFHEATTERPWFPLHKNDRTEKEEARKRTSHKKDISNSHPEIDTLKISKDDSLEGAKLKFPEESPNEENFPIYREPTYEEQFSIDRERSSERQSFGLYKDNVSEETTPLEEGNLDSEGQLVAPTEPTVGEMFDLYEDTTYSEAITDSTTVEETTTLSPQLLEKEVQPEITTTSQSLISTSTLQSQPTTPEDWEIYTREIEEDALSKEEVKNEENFLIISNVTDVGKDSKPDENSILNSFRDIQKSISASPVTTSGIVSEQDRAEPEITTVPFERLSPTSSPSLKAKVDKDGQSEVKQSQSLFDNVDLREEAGEEEREERENTLSSFPKAHQGASDSEQFESCCESGQKWASEHQHCNHLPTVTQHNAICGVVQEQCCVGALREGRCLSGINAAKAGAECEESSGPLCGENTQKECCSCCALGLRLRREGKGCDVHQHLSFPCGHVFLTCCEEEEEEEEEGGGSVPVLRRKEKPRPTALPKRENNVAEEEEEEDNRVKEEEDRPFTLATPLQETTAQIPPLPSPCSGNSLCSQQCSVVRGKARCSCFPGFSLMADGQSCEDLNECVTNTHTCLAGERCVNTVGAYVCERLISCPSGYQLRNGVCEGGSLEFSLSSLVRCSEIYCC
uniref:Fibulin 2 n=1 Tax=Astyanax mexicanus TaxID=7994 RepID=A0A8B9GTU2_ASTMX